MSDFRSDPEWQQRCEQWTADRRCDETSTDALMRRLVAIGRMYRIESAGARERVSA